MIPLLQFGGNVSFVQTRNLSDQTFCFRLLYVQVCDSPLAGDAFLYGSLIFRLLETRVVVDSTLTRVVFWRIWLEIAPSSLLFAMKCWRSIELESTTLENLFIHPLVCSRSRVSSGVHWISASEAFSGQRAWFDHSYHQNHQAPLKWGPWIVWSGPRNGQWFEIIAMEDWRCLCCFVFRTTFLDKCFYSTMESVMHIAQALVGNSPSLQGNSAIIYWN